MAMNHKQLYIRISFDENLNVGVKSMKKPIGFDIFHYF
jgi:hypothetical protein